MNSENPTPEDDRLVWADHRMDEWGPVLIMAATIEMGGRYRVELDKGRPPAECWRIAEAAAWWHMYHFGRDGGLEEPAGALAAFHADVIVKIARHTLEPKAKTWVNHPARAKANGHDPQPYKTIGDAKAWKCRCGTLSVIVDNVESGGHGKCSATPQKASE